MMVRSGDGLHVGWKNKAEQKEFMYGRYMVLYGWAEKFC